MKHTILVIGIFIMFCGCYKDVPKPGQSYHLIPQTVLDYTSFQVGTYWIYQDSATGKLDSQWIAASNSGFDYFTKNSNYFLGYYQYFTYTMYDTMYNTEMIISCSMTQSSNGYNAFVLRDISNNSGINSCPMFYYPYSVKWYDSGTPPNYVGNAVQFISYSSLNVLNKIFNNVVRIHQYDNCYDQEINSYMAKYIGVVKLQLLKNHQTWDLIRYHIVQ